MAQAGAGDDVLLRRAHNHIGEYYADRQKWSKAVAYFAQAKNTEQLVGPRLWGLRTLFEFLLNVKDRIEIPVKFQGSY